MKCEQCNAFKSTNPKGGICRANPPQLMVFGMEQVRVPGLRANQMGQRPVTGSGFPETSNDGWCRQFMIDGVAQVTSQIPKQDNTPFTFDAAKCQPVGEVSPIGGGLLSERE